MQCGQPVNSAGAGGGNRTHTPLAGPRILSPVRLPVPPPRPVEGESIASTSYADRLLASSLVVGRLSQLPLSSLIVRSPLRAVTASAITRTFTMLDRGRSGSRGPESQVLSRRHKGSRLRVGSHHTSSGDGFRVEHPEGNSGERPGVVPSPVDPDP